MTKKRFGLIGFPLTHSFSKKYFSEKFQELGIANSHSYDLFEIESVEKLTQIIKEVNGLVGLNVTIPHKLSVIPFLSEMDPAAKKIGAVNVILVDENKNLKGYNSDYYGFKRSLVEFLGTQPDGLKALVLGNGGAAKAIIVVLQDMGIPFKLVSRKATENTISYQEANTKLEEYSLIVNCTPLGTYPNVETCPNLEYEKLGENHYLFDLVYNPVETRFLKEGKIRGAKTLNGYKMLVYQAEKSWEIWNKKEL